MAEKNLLTLLKARDQVAGETFARIRKAGEGKRWQIQAFLNYLQEHLFDVRPGVQRLMRLSRITDRSFATYFHAEIGCPPSAYIRHAKMEVAAELLRTTDSPIGLIGEAVGIPWPTQFSRDFRRWSGETPKAYRDRHRAGEGPSLPVHSPHFAERAFAGDLEHHEAELYIIYLQDLYSLSVRPPLAEMPDSTFDEEVRAEVVWRRLRDKSFEQQNRIVRFQYGFRTAALFNLLLEKSREEGRTIGRRRGMELAELAIASLDATADTLASNVPNLRARGWACLGNARRLALDFEGAEMAFDQAQLAWSVPRKNEDHLVLAELLAFKAMLRYFQRRFDEALDLNQRAIELLRVLEAPEPLAQALIARAAMRESCGQPEQAIPALQEALGVLEVLDRPRLKTIALCNLVNAYVTACLYQEAHRLLPEAKSLVAGSQVKTAPFNLQWIEGRIRKAQGAIASAEKLFVEARRGFSALGEADYEAVVSLDLALLYAEQERSTEALRLAAGAIPFFESFSIRREATVALQLIREALSQSSLPLAVLEKIRGHVEELRKDPWFGFSGRRHEGRAGADPR